MNPVVGCHYFPPGLRRRYILRVDIENNASSGTSRSFFWFVHPLVTFWGHISRKWGNKICQINLLGTRAVSTVTRPSAARSSSCTVNTQIRVVVLTNGLFATLTIGHVIRRKPLGGALPVIDVLYAALCDVRYSLILYSTPRCRVYTPLLPFAAIQIKKQAKRIYKYTATECIKVTKRRRLRQTNRRE